MTFKEFEVAMTDILNTFDPKNYPGPKTEMIFDECSDLDVRDFRWIVRQFVADLPVFKPPQPNQFREAAAYLRKWKHDNRAVSVGNQPVVYEEGGLSRILDHFKANSLMEAVSIASANARKGPSTTEGEL